MADYTENSSNERPIRSLTIRDIIQVFFRHKWKMLFFFLIVMCLVTVVNILSPEIYYSEAKLLLKLGRESVTLDPTATTGPIMHVSQSRESEVNSEIEILRGRDLIEKVIDSIGQEQFAAKPDEASVEGGTGRRFVRNVRKTIRSVMQWPRNLLINLDMIDELTEREKIILGVINGLYVGASKDSSIVKISYEAQSPTLAQRVVAELTNLYLEKHIAAHRTPGSYQFFLEQTELLREKLKTSEEKLKNLKNKAGVTSIERQQVILLENIQTLKEEQNKTESELSASSAKVQSMEKAIVQIPEATILAETTGYPNLGADTMRGELFKLQIEEQKLLKNFTDDSRSVESVRKEITRAQELLNKEKERTQITKGINRSYQELQLTLLIEKANKVSLEQKLNTLKQQLAETYEHLIPLNDLETEITSLMRDINTQEINLRKYSENLEQARIDQAMENQRISNISVIQHATLPLKSIRPRKLLNTALGLFIGIFGAFLLAASAELMDHSIKSPNDIEEKLLMTTLGYIPLHRHIFSRDRIASAMAERISGSLKKLLHKGEGSNGRDIRIPVKIQHNYEDLKDRLLQKLDGSTNNGGYTIAVTSCHRGEGVSTIVTNLSKILACHYKSKVLIIDANMDNPSIHKIFGLKLSKGLADILKTGDGQETLKKLNDIEIVTAGRLDEPLSDVLKWERFKKLLNGVKKKYDFVIVDLPALGQGAVASRLSGFCDGVILVIESEKLHREVAQNGKKELAASNAKTLGAILNKRRFYIPSYIYKAF